MKITGRCYGGDSLAGGDDTSRQVTGKFVFQIAVFLLTTIIMDDNLFSTQVSSYNLIS
jgi:hypothetical protein